MLVISRRLPPLFQARQLQGASGAKRRSNNWRFPGGPSRLLKTASVPRTPWTRTASG